MTKSSSSNLSLEPIFTISNKLWIYPGVSAWHFLTVNKKVTKEIKSLSNHIRRGFGSVKVKAQIGNSEWTTSIFPTKDGEYLLPIKASIRKVENLRADKMTTVLLTLI